MNCGTLLLGHWACTLLMTGIIWFVQVVHYPLMERVGPQGFREYARLHQARTSWVVIGPMLLEVATAAALGLLYPRLGRSPAFAMATLLLVVVWASTFLWQVPLHRRLSDGYDLPTLRRLVASNWLRTAAWTLRAILLGVVVGRGDAAAA